MTISIFNNGEEKYTFPQSSQIMGQTGCAGYLYGTFLQKGDTLSTWWELERDISKSKDFTKELNDIMEFY